MFNSPNTDSIANGGFIPIPRTPNPTGYDADQLSAAAGAAASAAAASSERAVSTDALTPTTNHSPPLAIPPNIPPIPAPRPRAARISYAKRGIRATRDFVLKPD